MVSLQNAWKNQSAGHLSLQYSDWISLSSSIRRRKKYWAHSISPMLESAEGFVRIPTLYLKIPTSRLERGERTYQVLPL